MGTNLQVASQQTKRIGEKIYTRILNTSFYANPDGTVLNVISRRKVVSKTIEGYLQFSGGQRSTMKRQYVHHWIMKLFGSQKPLKEGHWVIDHINGIPDDNRIENLQWLTHKENIEKGNLKRKLNSEQVKEIRKLSLEGISQRKLAKIYRVHRGTIQAVLEKKTFSYVK